MSDPSDSDAPGISLADATVMGGGTVYDDDTRHTEILRQVDVPRLVAGYLLPHEHQVIAVQRHPVVLLPAAAAFLGGLATAIALNSWLYVNYLATIWPVRLIWIAWLAAALWATGQYLSWRVTWFVATASRLMFITGLLRRDVTPLPLARLTDLRMGQEMLLGRKFGWGTLICESFATDHALHEITYLPYVQSLFNEIWAMRTPVPATRGPEIDDLT